MQCPVCKDVQLVMSERQKIEIDYCPQCRGVWLDRGELDKVIERSESEAQAARASQPLPQQGQPMQQPNPYYSGHGGGHGRGHSRGFLGRLFD